MRRIGVVFFAALLFLILGAGFTTPKTARFGSGIAFLLSPETPGGHLPGLFPTAISPFANFVAGIAAPDADRNGFYVHLWDTREIDPEGTVTQPAPTRTVRVEAPIISARLLPDVAFSPDEQYLAVQSTAGVVLYTLPDMATYKTLPLSNTFRFGSLTWSTDASLLAVWFDNDRIAIVWDVEQDQTHRHPFEQAYRHIHVFGGDWLLTGSLGAHPEIAICERLLEQCSELLSPAPVQAIDPNAQIIVVYGRERLDEPFVPVQVWRRDGNQNLILDPMPFAGLEERLLPKDFSPSGMFVAAASLERPGRMIWDIERLEIIQETPEQNPVVWLANDGFFVGRSLRLYQRGQSQPIDELDLSIVDGFDSLNAITDPIFIANKVGVNDGGWVLQDRGVAAILVPILFA